MSELDQEEEVTQNSAQKTAQKPNNRQRGAGQATSPPPAPPPAADPTETTAGDSKADPAAAAPPLSPEALVRIEGAAPLRAGDPDQIQGFKVVGRDPDDGELLVEFPEREPLVAMSLIKCPACQHRMYVSTSKGKLATRSYTVCTNDECYYFQRTGKRKRGAVERRLTTNIKRFDEIGIVAGQRVGGRRNV